MLEISDERTVALAQGEPVGNVLEEGLQVGLRSGMRLASWIVGDSSEAPDLPTDVGISPATACVTGAEVWVLLNRSPVPKSWFGLIPSPPPNRDTIFVVSDNQQYRSNLSGDAPCNAEQFMRALLDIHPDQMPVFVFDSVRTLQRLERSAHKTLYRSELEWGAIILQWLSSRSEHADAVHVVVLEVALPERYFQPFGVSMTMIKWAQILGVDSSQDRLAATEQLYRKVCDNSRTITASLASEQYSLGGLIYTEKSGYDWRYGDSRIGAAARHTEREAAIERKSWYQRLDPIGVELARWNGDSVLVPAGERQEAGCGGVIPRFRPGDNVLLLSADDLIGSSKKFLLTGSVKKSGGITDQIVTAFRSATGESGVQFKHKHKLGSPHWLVDTPPLSLHPALGVAESKVKNRLFNAYTSTPQMATKPVLPQKIRALGA